MKSSKPSKGKSTASERCSAQEHPTPRWELRDPLLSADGKTLTFTTTGLNANGQQINDFAAYEKQ